MKILFPRDIGQKYYGAHYKFLLNIFEFMDLDIKLCDLEPSPSGGFVIMIDDKRVLIDFSNFLQPVDEDKDIDIYFKYEYPIDYRGQYKNMYPMGKISFHDWGDYFKLREVIKYNCNTDVVLNNQRARHGAQERRLHVRKMLQDEYSGLVDVEITGKNEFWEKINSCLASVCVPGQRNDILDRGQFQYMAFGACTLSPRINIVLPYMKPLEPWKHYIKCADDYSDLIEKIEWCKEHRAQCVEIGNNAKKLFYETCIPSAIWAWMEGIITKKVTL